LASRLNLAILGGNEECPVAAGGTLSETIEDKFAIIYHWYVLPM
jgi:hypothetical protein